ncbi:protein FAR1-RELATED SEQUENCE 5-like [Carya illinoinensis]|uniref:protein FAR1-RELATED SEQUENCE 5-like n=1 Tax=Carya illinoinensis TaxID=32201 RepID=UPI001C71DB1E|nr:protein FAR1-RELATED SEQUENCE 5-like [Carya illinoinensis]
MEEIINNNDQTLVIDHTPKLGLEFDYEQEAYDFYNEYGRNYGFSIRREWYNKRKVDGLVTSRKFVCCKEGLQAQCERDRQKRYERAETRTGCKAHMIIRHDKEKQKYCIHSIELNHNHALHIPQCAHMMPSQRKISKAQALEIDLADDSGIQLKDSYEFMGRQVGGKDALGYTKQDQKNYLHNKRQRELKYGEAGISFDTTYRTNKEYRPLAMFVGFNHHRETAIFGAALLYDETIESFKWLFETFFEAMSSKKPKTIFTDQDPAMAKAISMVMPSTYHRLCKWHLMQNAMKHVGHLLREKWAKAYVKMSFSAGMTSTQLSESLNSDLKDYLQSDYDIVKFFTHFERLLNAKRYKELQVEYNLRQKLPKVKIASPMLVQAANTYTSQLFLKFQKQYEEFQGAFVKERGERDLSHEYVVSIYGKPKDRRVIWNSLENNVSCSCRKFERCEILCSHALKILDVMDIKVLPEKYILKRWTKEAKNESVQDFNGHDIITDTNLEVTTRYKSLCPLYVKLISRAAECEEAYMLTLENYKEIIRS